MGTFAAGDVIVLPFPFSDLSRNKFRPALLLAGAARGDRVACQINSNAYAAPAALALTSEDFAVGGLQRISDVRPGKLFTANEAIFFTVAGHIQIGKLALVREAVVRLIRAHPQD